MVPFFPDRKQADTSPWGMECIDLSLGFLAKCNLISPLSCLEASNIE